MTRFSTRVERDLGQIADRATPSSTAWDSILQRIDDQDVHNAIEPTMEVIMLSPDRNEPPRRNRVMIGAAAVLATLALIGGLIVVATRSGGEQIPADEPPPAPTSQPDPDPETGDAVEPLPFPGADVDPGTYETALLGVPLVFDVPVPMKLWTATENRIELSDFFDTTFSPPPQTARMLSFTRISGWNTPAESVDFEYSGPGSIDALDIDGWAGANDLDAEVPPCCRTVDLGEGTERVDTSLGGRTVTPLDVRIDPAVGNPTFECGEVVPDQQCAWAASLSGRETADDRIDKDPLLIADQVNRLLLIEIDGEDPLLVHASAPVGDEAWLELVDDLVLSESSLPLPGTATAPDAEL